MAAADAPPTPARAGLLVGDALLDAEQVEQRDARLIIPCAEQVAVLVEKPAVTVGKFPERQILASLVPDERVEVRDEAALNKREQVRPLLQTHPEAEWRSEAKRPVGVRVERARHTASGFAHDRGLCGKLRQDAQLYVERIGN